MATKVIEKESTVKRELRLGVVLSYLLIFINVVSGLLLVPAILKGVGSSNYGLYTAATSLVSMFIVDLGLGIAITKFVSKFRVISNQKEINKVTTVISTCFIALSVILLIAFTTVFFFLDRIYTSFTPEELSSFRIVYIIVASYSVFIFPFNITNGLLIGYDKIVYSKVADLISKVAFIVATIVVLKLNLGLYMLTACYALHGLVGALLKFFFVIFKTPARLKFKLPGKEFLQIFKQVITFSLWAAINSFGRVLLVSIVPAILGFVSSEAKGSTEIALFSIAYQIESYVSFFATAFGSIFYPSISRILFKDGEVNDSSLEKFKEFHISIARVQAIILLLVIAGLWLCGREFIYLWVGEGFEKSFYSILIMCTPALFFYPLQTAENAMAAVEKIKYCAISTVISLALGVGFIFLFSYYFGSIGAAIGVCLSTFIRIVLFNVCFKKFLKLRPFEFYFRTFASLLLPLVLILTVGKVLNLVFPNPSWIKFVFKVGVISLIYVIAVFAFGLNDKEQVGIKKWFKSHLKKNNKTDKKVSVN